MTPVNASCVIPVNPGIQGAPSPLRAAHTWTGPRAGGVRSRPRIDTGPRQWQLAGRRFAVLLSDPVGGTDADHALPGHRRSVQCRTAPRSFHRLPHDRHLQRNQPAPGRLTAGLTLVSGVRQTASTATGATISTTIPSAVSLRLTTRLRTVGRVETTTRIHLIHLRSRPQQLPPPPVLQGWRNPRGFTCRGFPDG